MSLLRFAIHYQRKGLISLWLPFLRYGPHRHISQNFSITSDNIEVSMDDATGIALLRMKKAPVNSFNQAMLTDLNIALEKLENDRKCRALIITSVLPRVFCAGLELTELYQPKKENLDVFWQSFQDLWKNLYGSRLVTVAAINGHSPAAGCILAMCCDHRVMAAGKYTIGLPAVLLGYSAPPWLMSTMINTIGFRETERALKLGFLYSPTEALKISLVDVVVPETDVMESAQQAVVQYLTVPDYARELTKQALRRPTLNQLIGKETEDANRAVDNLMSDETQLVFGQYLQKLKSKNK